MFSVKYDTENFEISKPLRVFPSIHIHVQQYINTIETMHNRIKF